MFAAVYIPDFSLQSLLRHEPDLRSQPVALTDPELPKPVIIQMTAAARNSGVAEGLTPGQAMARCEGLIIKTRSRLQEKSAAEILLQTACAFSPNIEDTASGVCTMELKGLGLESQNAAQSWAEKIIRALEPFYPDAQIGFGATPDLALLAARNTERDCGRNTGRNTIGPSGLPISTLEPPEEVLEVLSRWGVRTVGEFLALGKDNVAGRLGPAAAQLFGRVSPDSIRPLKLVSPPEHFSEQIEFENEIETAEPLLFVLRRFVEQLSRRLEMIYLVIGEFRLELGLSSGAKYGRTFKIPSPTGNIETLFRMLQTHLETLRTDSPVVSLELAAAPASPDARQFGLFESTLRNPNQFAGTLARLIALVGPENAGTPILETTYKPDSFRMTSPEFDDAKGARLPSKSRPQHVGNFEGAAAGAAHTAVVPLQLRRFRPAVPAHIGFWNEKPVVIRSDAFNGAIAGSRGPFFSSGNWWDDNRWAREEWDIETSDGSLLRIFRSEEGGFVEGVYD